MTPEYLFVYGSLRRAAAHPMHRQLRLYCSYVGPAHLQGRLYEISGYPGALQSSQQADVIIGELYRVNHAEPLFAVLDHYEECSPTFPLPHAYQRRAVSIWLADNRRESAWAYLYQADTSALTRIDSGDYLNP